MVVLPDHGSTKRFSTADKQGHMAQSPRLTPNVKCHLLCELQGIKSQFAPGKLRATVRTEANIIKE